MAIVKKVEYGAQKSISARPDGLVAYEYNLKASDYSGVEAVDGRKILPAGTIVKDSGGKAIGVLFNDEDITDGDVENVALVVHGDLNYYALPVAPTQEEVDEFAKIGLYVLKDGVIEKPDVLSKTTADATYAAKA